jgi:hypothetical protein
MYCLTEQGEGVRTIEQVFDVGGGDVFHGLVGGEEVELTDYLVAAPQQLENLRDPFYPLLIWRRRLERR